MLVNVIGGAFRAWAIARSCNIAFSSRDIGGGRGVLALAVGADAGAPFGGDPG